MSERVVPGSPLEGPNLGLSRELEQAVDQAGLDRSHYLPQGHTQGEMIVGVPINKDFNRGVEAGPHRVSNERAETMVADGAAKDVDAARIILDAQAKRAAIGRNTYPLPPEHIRGELTRMDAVLEHEERRHRAA